MIKMEMQQSIITNTGVFLYSFLANFIKRIRNEVNRMKDKQKGSRQTVQRLVDTSCDNGGGKKDVNGGT
jgi:hypothetical protein